MPFQKKLDSVPAVDWQIGLPASTGEADVILIFGGDGTVHRYLEQLVSLSLPVLIVPVGSGNDFARALGFRRVKHSLMAWREFRAGADNVRSIDLGVVAPLPQTHSDSAAKEATALSSGSACDAPRYFCSIAGVGLDAEVARRANRLPRWLRGHGGYALSLATTLFRFAASPMKIFVREGNASSSNNPTHSGWTIRSHQSTILAAFANSSAYGGGMKIAPRAEMDDGALDVCVISALDPLKLFCLFPTVYFGRHLKVREVEYFQSSHLRVETETPLDIYADGEYVCRTPAEIRVAGKILKVVTP